MALPFCLQQGERRDWNRSTPRRLPRGNTEAKGGTAAETWAKSPLRWEFATKGKDNMAKNNALSKPVNLSPQLEEVIDLDEDHSAAFRTPRAGAADPGLDQAGSSGRSGRPWWKFW